MRPQLTHSGKSEYCGIRDGDSENNKWYCPVWRNDSSYISSLRITHAIGDFSIRSILPIFTPQIKFQIMVRVYFHTRLWFLSTNTAIYDFECNQISIFIWFLSEIQILLHFLVVEDGIAPYCSIQSEVSASTCRFPWSLSSQLLWFSRNCFLGLLPLVRY